MSDATVQVPAIQVPSPGQFVLAHSWSSGTRSQKATYGLILGPWIDLPDCSMQLVWFLEQGAPAAGASVHPIDPEHMQPSHLHVDNIPMPCAAQYHHMISQAPASGEAWERVRAAVLPMLERRLQVHTNG